MSFSSTLTPLDASLGAQPLATPPTAPGTPCPTPRLQKIIHRNDGAEESCTERDGWCLPKTSDSLRNAMSLMIRQTIRSKRPGESRMGQRSLGTEQVSLMGPFSRNCMQVGSCGP